MAKTLTLHFDDDTYQLIADTAEAENQSVAGLVQEAALTWIRERDLVGNAETAEIRADHDLMQRLKQGAADAAAGRGRFVE